MKKHKPQSPAVFDGTRLYLNSNYTNYVLKADIPQVTFRIASAATFQYLACPCAKHAVALRQALRMHRDEYNRAPPKVYEEDASDGR